MVTGQYCIVRTFVAYTGYVVWLGHMGCWLRVFNNAARVLKFSDLEQFLDGWLWPISRYLHSIHPEELRKSMRNFGQDNRSPG
jgi:hypothetical protein